MDEKTRRFACTTCGSCCSRGPELELGETTELAGKFVMSTLFKVHSLPLGERSAGARDWWKRQDSTLPMRAALEERKRHISLFASRRETQRTRERQIFLEISAIVDDDGLGKCPALSDQECSIYERRPLTCRTVPMHYSRAPSTLLGYIDQFTSSAGYQCDTSAAAPMVLVGNAVVDNAFRERRSEAVACAKADRAWKNLLLSVMDDPRQADAIGLPSYRAVLENSDRGYATLVPMLAAWKVAATHALIPANAFMEICEAQRTLIKMEIARMPSPGRLRDLIGTLSMFDRVRSTT